MSGVTIASALTATMSAGLFLDSLDILSFTRLRFRRDRQDSDDEVSLKVRFTLEQHFVRLGGGGGYTVGIEYLTGAVEGLSQFCGHDLNDEADPEPEHLAEQTGLRADAHGQEHHDLLQHRDKNK